MLICRMDFIFPQALCQLEDCLAEFTRLEVLDEYTCRKCSLIDALRRLKSQTISPSKTSAARKHQKELKKTIAQVESAIADDPDRPLDPSSESEIDPILSRATTKQTMFSRVHKLASRPLFCCMHEAS